MRRSARRDVVVVVGAGIVLSVVAAAATVGIAIVTGAGVGRSAGVAGIVLSVVAAIISPREKGQFPGIRQLPGMVRGALRASVAPVAGEVPTGAGWRLMGLAARLMPPAAGRRWLAEAGSFLAEAPPALRRGAIRSYLAGAPQVVILSWAGEVARRARISGDRPR